MLRRQLINTVTRYSHQHCNKNFPPININCEKNEKIDQLLENNKQFTLNVDRLHSKIDILFVYNFIVTVAIMLKSITN
jgi:hypothetical protein